MSTALYRSPVCSACRRLRPCPGEGPTPSPILVLGESPGETEDWKRRPFVGPSGRELDYQYLPLSGYCRPDVYVSNAIKCVRGSTKVLLPGGEWRRINDLVKTNYNGPIITVNRSGERSRSLVTAVHRSPIGKRKLYRLSYQNYRSRGTNCGLADTVLTGDHEVLTKLGWKPVSELLPTDLVCTGTPGLKRTMPFVVGMRLGDTSLTPREFKLCHCPKQKDYLYLKAGLLSHLGGKPKTNPLTGVSYWSSRAHPVIRWLYSLWPDHNKLSRPLLDAHFNWQSLAIWFMDDGYAQMRGNHVNAEICATRFCESDLEYLVDLIRNRTGLECTTRGGRIHFGVDAARELIDGVAEYVPQCLRYKLPHRPDDVIASFSPRAYPSDSGELFWDTPVVKKVKPLPSENTVYCLSVASTESFITRGGVVHNCRQGKRGGDDPDPSEVLTCALHHLPGELARVRPHTIVTLGAVALHLFGPHSLEMHHGRPIPNQSWCNWEGTLFPVYHPAAGLRKSEYMIDLQSDFKALNLYRQGKLHLPIDSHPRPHYRALDSVDDLLSTLRRYQERLGGFTGLELAMDTETIGRGEHERIWCLSFSMAPGTGYLIRADNEICIRIYREWLAHVRPLVVYHNYLFDAPKLAQLGIVTPNWADTMQEAYELCSFPQSLKVLAYRYLGMTMQEYEDLVSPYALDRALEWLHLASKTVVPGYVEGLPWKHKKLRCSGGKDWGGKHESTGIEFTEPGTVGCPVCGKPKGSGGMERDRGGRRLVWERAGEILRDVMEKGVSPWKRWEGVDGEDRDRLVEMVGEMPKGSIEQVPFGEVVGYACRDSDATLRLKPVLRKAMAEMGRGVRGR